MFNTYLLHSAPLAMRQSLRRTIIPLLVLISRAVAANVVDHSSSSDTDVSSEESIKLSSHTAAPTAAGTPHAALSLSIQQFGARGDGVSDDAPAFRAAFAALATTGGGTLTVP